MKLIYSAIRNGGGGGGGGGDGGSSLCFRDKMLRNFDTNTLTDYKNQELTQYFSDYPLIRPLCSPSGADYTASFSRKGQVRPLALLEKNQNAIEMFSKLGDEEVINDEQCADGETCMFYVWTKETVLRCGSSSRNVP